VGKEARFTFSQGLSDVLQNSLLVVFEIPATHAKGTKKSLQLSLGNSAKSFSKNRALTRAPFAKTAQNEEKFPAFSLLYAG
jgi:hypothetical protein